MSATFSIEVDVGRDLVRIRMAGLFAPEDVRRFLAERALAHRQLRCGLNQHLTLNDLSALKIQPQTSVVAFRDLLADPRHRSRRLAFVIGKTLARGQLLRALNGRDARCFDDPVAAEAWLLEAAPETEPRRYAAR